VIGGIRPGKGERRGGIGSLLLGIPDAEGLRYVGRVGSGFTDRELARLEAAAAAAHRRQPLRRCPCADAADALWLRPELVGEVEFAEFTPNGTLRHARWRGSAPTSSRWTFAARSSPHAGALVGAGGSAAKTATAVPSHELERRADGEGSRSSSGLSRSTTGTVGWKGPRAAAVADPRSATSGTRAHDDARLNVEHSSATATMTSPRSVGGPPRSRPRHRRRRIGRRLVQARDLTRTGDRRHRPQRRQSEDERTHDDRDHHDRRSPPDEQRTADRRAGSARAPPPGRETARRRPPGGLARPLPVAGPRAWPPPPPPPAAAPWRSRARSRASAPGRRRCRRPAHTRVGAASRTPRGWRHPCSAS
jgi:hypothetical protein